MRKKDHQNDLRKPAKTYVQQLENEHNLVKDTYLDMIAYIFSNHPSNSSLHENFFTKAELEHVEVKRLKERLSTLENNDSLAEALMGAVKKKLEEIMFNEEYKHLPEKAKSSAEPKHYSLYDVQKEAGQLADAIIGVKYRVSQETDHLPNSNELTYKLEKFIHSYASDTIAYSRGW